MIHNERAVIKFLNSESEADRKKRWAKENAEQLAFINSDKNPWTEDRPGHFILKNSLLKKKGA